MKPLTLISLSCFLISEVLVAGREIQDQRRNYARLDPDANAGLLVEKRFQLELRHAGGPRREAVEDLLRLKLENGDRAWSREVLEACEARLVDCNDYLKKAEGKVKGSRGKEREVAEYDLDLFKKEATLEAMTVRQRRAFYLEALEKGRAQQAGVQLDAANAALRILGEGMHDLIGEIERAMAESRFPDSSRLHREIEIGKALISGDPKGRLVEFVRRGVAQAPDSPKALVAKAALKELRRLNLDGTAEELKEVVKLYEPMKAKQESEARELQQKAMAEGRHLSGGELSDPKAYLGFLGWQIIEAIGDLGDREFERRVLGGRTLWDQVNEAEKELVRRGKLQKSDMVSR